jgi:hypothetical protein
VGLVKMIRGYSESMRRSLVVSMTLAVVFLAVASGALASVPWLNGTFKMRFVVLRAKHVQPGRGATGTRTWIFEHQGSTLFLLEGLANGGYARVRLHRFGNRYLGTDRLRASCVNDPSRTGEDVPRYSVRAIDSNVRSGRLDATAIRAYLRETYTGCGAVGASELRRYVGRRAG